MPFILYFSYSQIPKSRVLTRSVTYNHFLYATLCATISFKILLPKWRGYGIMHGVHTTKIKNQNVIAREYSLAPGYIPVRSPRLAFSMEYGKSALRRKNNHETKNCKRPAHARPDAGPAANGGFRRQYGQHKSGNNSRSMRDLQQRHNYEYPGVYQIPYREL